MTDFKKLNLLVNHELYTLKDPESEDSKNPSRIFRDISTDSYVESFQNNENIRMMFIDYTWSILYVEINKVNSELFRDNQPLLYSDEDVKLMFKGGTIMNFLFSEEINKYTGSTISSDTLNIAFSELKNFKFDFTKTGELFFELKNNFKISDIDFSLYILTTNSSRYKLITDICTKLLYNGMNKISAFFENLMSKFNDGKSSPSKIIKGKIDDNCYTSLKKFYSPEFCKSTKIPTTFVNEINIVYDELISTYTIDNLKSKNEFNDIRYLVTVSNIYDYVKGIGEVLISNNLQPLSKNNDDDDVILYLSERISEVITNKEIELKNIKFYSQDSLVHFRNSIYKKLNDVVNVKGYEIYNDGITITKKEIVIPEPIIFEDIKIIKRPNLYLININDPLKQYSIFEGSEKNYHYITYNNIINVKSSSHNLCFKLMRIKLNVEYKNFNVNGIKKPQKIPSEVVDVSILDFSDSSYNNSYSHLIKTTNICELPVTTTNNVDVKYCIEGYSPEIIFEDLILTIFRNGNMSPWDDNKYTKRMKRIMFVGIIMSQNNVEKLDQYYNFIKFCANIKNEISKNSFSISIITDFFGHTTDSFNKIIKDYYKNDNYKKYEFNTKMFILGSNNMFKDIIITLANYYVLLHLFRENEKEKIQEYINHFNILRNYVKNDEDNDKFVANILKNINVLLNTIINYGYMIYYTVIQQQQIMVGGNNKKYFYEKKYLKYKMKHDKFKKNNL